MCGRYASTRSAADLAALFDAEDLTAGDLVPDYNIAPTDPAPIVLASTARSAVTIARWGFVPPWARDGGGRLSMINARAETVATSRAYGQAFAQRRCLVPADGWFEWRRYGTGRRQPYFMTLPGPVVFGGIWSPAAGAVTFSIVTIAAIGDLSTVHDRMPLVLDESRWSEWLRGAPGARLLAPPTPEYCKGFELRPVSAAVGDVRNDGPHLLQRDVAPELQRDVAPDVVISTVDQSPTLF